MAETLAERARERLLARNEVSDRFFPEETYRLAEACRHMAERFLAGGRLLAFGRGPYATDAQHVSVEFIHPAIVGKRALPALDLSIAFRPWLEAILRPEDIVIGFGPPEGDPEVAAALAFARQQGAQTFAFPGEEGDYAVAAPSPDPFIHQEMVEMLYHPLWETVHVFFEHRHLPGHDIGELAALYPFLGNEQADLGWLVPEVAASIAAKVREDERLRAQVAHEQANLIAEAAVAVADRLRRGGKLVCFGNGGSATDANDLAIDCVMPPPGLRPVQAVSLSLEPANLTAIANDVGQEVMFLRQLIPHLRPEDIAFGISTSGSSKNVVIALEEARKRGMLTVGLFGYDGGEIARRGLVDFALIVHCDYIPRIQEVQASIYHVLRELVEESLDGQT